MRTLRVQVPNNHILTQNLYYNYNYPKPKYLIIGYLDPLGKDRHFRGASQGKHLLGITSIERCHVGCRWNGRSVSV